MRSTMLRKRKNYEIRQCNDCLEADLARLFFAWVFALHGL